MPSLLLLSAMGRKQPVMNDSFHKERTRSMERIINWYRLESAAYFNNACYKQGNSMTRMAAVFTLLSCMASASALAASDCPFPQGMQASIGASKEAIAARQAGVAKDDLLSRISPAANGQMSKMLKSIVDEVYDYPALKPEVYAAFRFEHCFVSQQHAEQVAAMKFADAYPLLKKCEQLDPEGARPPCAMRVVHTLTGIPE
ncbi:hypothetical protein D3C76_1258600 [compost metagenome]